ncbi:PIN-like domain-containing protein [Bacillus spizizenii]|nr:PIN-like domain-containing protein [Bacillus spizizenii]MCY8394737.1 PIN-like domain-containing protein [Bacillus spizizenii]
MEDWKKYLHQPKPVTQLLNDSIIVINTNVLLAAYQWREVTVNEVLNALQKIKDENRLRIPLQVIKEFSRNRPHEIQHRINDLDTLISKMQKEKPLIEHVPMLEGKDSLKVIEELRANYNKAVKDYRVGLINLRDHLKELFYNDHFLDKIMKLAEGTILLPEQTEQDLEKEAKERFKLKLPPGFKDSSKEENSAGDFIVWSSILQLKSNVVFVSGDKKPDWVYQDSKKNPITARRELVEEFFIKTGRDFAHITPKDFITSLNPAVSEHVKEDLVNYKTINQQNLSRKDNENMNKNSFPNLKRFVKE